MRLSVRDVTYGALACALLAVCSYLPRFDIGPVPITFQTLAVMLAGLILPRRAALGGLVAYILLVAVGVPLLGPGKGGFQYLVGPTAGYIVSWPLAAYGMGWLADRLGRKFGANLLAAVLFGIGLVYLLGVPVLKLVTGMAWGAALAAGALPFVVGDLIKAVVASVIAVGVARRLPGVAPMRAPTAR
jgi:biotin transport system substrate-specific component